MGLNYFASSPTLVLPPQNQSHNLMHHPIEHHPPGPSNAGQSVEPAGRFATSTPHRQSLTRLAKSDRSVAGRKRSRADIGEDLDHEAPTDMSAAVASVHSSLASMKQCMTGYGVQQPVNPLPQPASTTGAAVAQSVSTEQSDHTERPQLVARKSQRRDQEAGDESGQLHVDIDPVIRKLGIGWKVIRDSQAPAVAGQQAFIRNQFAFQDPRILLQHNGLGILVVQTKPASAHGYWDQWWLFSDDLRSCRFLCHDESELFRRLDNKHQDERGIWQPEILVEGPIIYARDTAQTNDAANGSLSAHARPPGACSAESTQVQKDVEMQM